MEVVIKTGSREVLKKSSAPVSWSPAAKATKATGPSILIKAIINSVPLSPKQRSFRMKVPPGERHSDTMGREGVKKNVLL